MRKDPFLVGHYVHVYNRGNRKQEIVRDDLDRRHFLRALYYLKALSPNSPPPVRLSIERIIRGMVQ